MSQNVAAIVATAQSVDSFLASVIFSQTAALQILPEVKLISWSEAGCATAQDIEHCQPFAQDGPVIISAGYLLAALLLLPLGLKNLEENIVIQMASCVGFCLLVLEFVISFVMKGIDFNNAEWIGDDFSSLIGVVLFNYGFIVAVPAWLAEKKRGVNVNNVIWAASSYSTILYALFAVFGCLAFRSLSSDVLALLGSSEMGATTRMCALIFGLAMIGYFFKDLLFCLKMIMYFVYVIFHIF